MLDAYPGLTRLGWALSPPPEAGPFVEALRFAARLPAAARNNCFDSYPGTCSSARATRLGTVTGLLSVVPRAARDWITLLEFGIAGGQDLPPPPEAGVFMAQNQSAISDQQSAKAKKKTPARVPAPHRSRRSNFQH